MTGEAPEAFELSRGETYESSFGTEARRRVTLRSVEEHDEPYFHRGVRYRIFRDATLNVEVDGKPLRLVCGPYRLPVQAYGLSLLVDLVRGVEGGRQPVPLGKDARFSVKPASVPWCGSEPLAFPLEGWRWRAGNYAHTWNGFVHITYLGGKGHVYYHRGEDFGAMPDRHGMLAMAAGSVETTPLPNGDGGSNAVIIGNGAYRYRYAHANLPFIREDLAPGKAVGRGEELAKTGSTWNGRPARDPHLHVDISRVDTGGLVDSYPFILESYRSRYPQEVTAVAGGMRFCMAGDTLDLDGSLSCPSSGAVVTSWQWKFCDGTTADRARVRKRYPSAGTWTEELQVTDSGGRTGRDFVMVRVFEETGKDLPFAYLSHYPVRGIGAGAPVEFLMHWEEMEDAAVSWGDGASEPAKSRTHAYAGAGEYVVTLSGRSREGHPGVFKAAVTVE